jgi:hypothetical protein
MRFAAYGAAALAFASAAVTLYWTVGGTLLLDTVGGAFERLARERSAGAFALATVVIALKLLAGLLALALAREPGPRLLRLLLAAGAAGGALLALYGGVLVVVGALVLAGAIRSSGPVDEHALRWHVFLWDLWFLVWGLALLAATTHTARRARTLTRCEAAASAWPRRRIRST